MVTQKNEKSSLSNAWNALVYSRYDYKITVKGKVPYPMHEMHLYIEDGL